MLTISTFGLLYCKKDNNLDNSPKDDKSKLRVSEVEQIIENIEIFHRTNINEDYTEIVSSGTLKFSNICMVIDSDYDAYLNYEYGIELLVNKKEELSCPIDYIQNFSSTETNPYFNYDLIKTSSLMLLQVVDSMAPIGTESVDEFLNRLKLELKDRMINETLSNVEYIVLNSEIEVFISSTKSWYEILEFKNSSKEQSWWDRVKNYAKADALGGGANVLMDGAVIATAGVLTGGSGALGAAGASFAKGALVGSAIYGASEAMGGK
jgi:hypothetical protein